MPIAPTLEVREKEDGKKVIRGYALKFNALSQLLYRWFKEKIDARALDNTDMSDVITTVNHNLDKMLGRTSSGTLSLQKDKTGLFYEIDPPDTEAGREAIELISRGDITGSSFIFELNSQGDKWEKDDDGVEIRTLIDIKRIVELGPVVSPAYLQTEAGVAKRSFNEWTNENKPPEPEASAEVKHARYHAELLNKKYN